MGKLYSKQRSLHPPPPSCKYRFIFVLQMKNITNYNQVVDRSGHNEKRCTRCAENEPQCTGMPFQGCKSR